LPASHDEASVNEVMLQNANPTQMMALRRASTSATNAGQANTTTEVAYLSSGSANAKWNAIANAAHKLTRRGASTTGQRRSYAAQ